MVIPRHIVRNDDGRLENFIGPKVASERKRSKMFPTARTSAIPDGRNETKVLTRCSRILIALQEAGKGKHVLSSF